MLEVCRVRRVTLQLVLKDLLLRPLLNDLTAAFIDTCLLIVQNHILQVLFSPPLLWLIPSLLGGLLLLFKGLRLLLLLLLLDDLVQSEV